MLTRFALGFTLAVSSLVAVAACSSSSSPATPTSGCVPLSVCCLTLPASSQVTCNAFVSSGVATVCAEELTAYTATGACGGTVTGPDAGTPPGTSCASLSTCCAQMTAPAACDAVVAAGNQTSCASTLTTDEAAGLCKAKTGPGVDGGTNPDTGSGGGCVGGCNAGESCVSGTCKCDAACTGTLSCNGADRCVAGACTPGGSACTTFSECCSGTCANDVCNACVSTGASCTGGTDCCTGLTCYDGTCGSCAGDGTTCTLASDCCSNICNEGSCQTCAQTGSTCASTTDCCSGSSCTSGVCCNAQGGTCSSDTDCCGGLSCSNGTCSLLAPGATCTETTQCGGGLPCTMWSPDGTTNYEQCCILVGGTTSCATDADCCGSAQGIPITCGGGQCQVPVGYECTAADQCAGGFPCTTDGPIMACGDASGSSCTSATTCLIGACTSDKCCSASAGVCLTATDCCTVGATCTGATSTTSGTCSE